MKVLKVHSRVINQPIEKIGPLLLSSLATKKDKIWSFEKWPSLRFKDCFHVGSKGGHGPIKYFIKKLEPQHLIEFQITSPKNFNGVHRLEVNNQNETFTILKHAIDMNTKGIMANLKWVFAIRPLHDAFIEDAFDNEENHFSSIPISSKWTLLVRFLRWILG